MGQMWRALPEAEREKYKASLTRLPTSGRGGMRAWVPANMALTPPSAPVVASHPARDPPPAPAIARPLPSPPARAMAGTMFDRWDDLQQQRRNAEAAAQATAYYTTHQGYIAPAPVPFGGPAVLASHARSHAPLIGAAMGQVVQARCASRISAMPSAAPAAAPSSAPAFAPPPHSQGSPLFATHPANAAPVLTTTVGPFGTRRVATDVQELATNSVPPSKRAAPAAPADAPPGKMPCTNPSGAPVSYMELCRQAPASFTQGLMYALQQSHAGGQAPQSSDNLPGFDNVCMLSGGPRPFQAQVIHGHTPPVHLGVARSPEVQAAAIRAPAESYVRGTPVQPRAPPLAEGATDKGAPRADQSNLAPGLTLPRQESTPPDQSDSEDHTMAAMALTMLSDHRPTEHSSPPPPQRLPPPQAPNQLAQGAAAALAAAAAASPPPPPPPPPPLSDELSGPELRRRCAEVGLPQYGTRAQMVARLQKHKRVQCRTYKAAQRLAGRCPSPPPRSPPLERSSPPQRLSSPSPPRGSSGRQATPQADASEQPPFTWSECHNLISTDASGMPVRHGVLVRQPSAMASAAVKLQAQLQLPLLYSAERRSWLWHKKWRLPKLQVQVS